MDDAKQSRRAEAYAAKFAADTVSAEPPIPLEPTYDNLRQNLNRCVKRPQEDLLPLIREMFYRRYGAQYRRLSALRDLF